MLTARERRIAAGAAIAVALLVVDRLVWTPLLDWRDGIEAERGRLADELARDLNRIRARRELAPRWREIAAGGLAADAVLAESRLLHALRDAASESQVRLASVRPEQPRPVDDGIGSLQVAVSGTGSLDAVARLLHQLDTTSLPLRVERLQLSAADASAGPPELRVELRLSTLFRGSAREPAAAGAIAPRAG
jgi:type II secretory pathway component PulM